MHLSRPIPDEIWEAVMSHLEDDRQSLKAVVLANCLASSAATRIYWQNTLACKDLLTELEEQPQNKQQFLASLIHTVVIDFKPLNAHHEGTDLVFPLLQRVMVEHDQDLGREETCVHARISHLVSPLLRELDIGWESRTFSDVQPITDNFLVNLSTCGALRSLKIRARINDATPQDLVLVLRNCARLSELQLEMQNEELMDETVIETIARHSSITCLDLNQCLDRRLTSLVAAIREPLSKLTYLTLCADTVATALFLPRLEQLETLHLTVLGTSSMFSHLRDLKQLRSIWIKFDSYTLTDNDLCHLIPLKKLESLELSDVEGFHGLDASGVDANVFAAVLGALPSLRSLNLDAVNQLGDAFLLAVGRGCRELQSLTLTGQFALEALLFEQSTLFPCLTTLELGSIMPTVAITPTSYQPWARRRAANLAIHAPELRFLCADQDSAGGLGGLVEEEWQSLKSEGG